MRLPSFDGAVAFVTGGAPGIGRATATRLAAEGATVVVADVQRDAGEKVSADIGGRFVALDVTDSGAWDAAVDSVLGTEGRLCLADRPAEPFEFGQLSVPLTPTK